jgi:putative intracellular protease/amidase
MIFCVQSPYTIADGKLITGQNPMSSEKLAELTLEVLGAEKLSSLPSVPKVWL